MTTEHKTNVADLVPADACYEFNATTSLATFYFDNVSSVTAKLSVVEVDGDKYINADYVSHDGDLSESKIEYARRVMETNDLGVSVTV